MRVTVDCENKTEFDELVKQLDEEGINYQTRILERKTIWLTDDETREKYPDTTAYEYAVFFWYYDRLV